jgi:DNA-binding XRE family transcriptional regulator
MGEITTDRTVWIRIREAFEGRGESITQIALATKLKISQPSVSEWNEAGKYPKLEHAVEVARLANICVEWLYTERGPMRPTAVDPNFALLNDNWARLPDLTKGKILMLAETALEATAGSLRATATSPDEPEDTVQHRGA